MLHVNEREELRTLLRKRRGYRKEISEKANNCFLTVVDGYFRGENNSQRVEEAALQLADEVSTQLVAKNELKTKVFEKLRSHDTERTA